jgi:hypothetical protein
MFYPSCSATAIATTESKGPPTATCNNREGAPNRSERPLFFLRPMLPSLKPYQLAAHPQDRCFYFSNLTLSRIDANVLSYFSYSFCGATHTKETSPAGRITVINQSVSSPPDGDSLLK